MSFVWNPIKRLPTKRTIFNFHIGSSPTHSKCDNRMNFMIFFLLSWNIYLFPSCISFNLAINSLCVTWKIPRSETVFHIERHFLGYVVCVCFSFFILLYCVKIMILFLFFMKIANSIVAQHISWLEHITFFQSIYLLWIRFLFSLIWNIVVNGERGKNMFTMYLCYCCNNYNY